MYKTVKVEEGNSEFIHDQYLMSLVMKNIQFNSWVLIFFNLIIIHECRSDICSICFCSLTDLESKINCHEQLFRSNNIIQLNSLTLDQYEDTQEVILSKNNLTLLPNVFMNLKHLQKLDLSENLISEIYTNVFTKFKNLSDLNYSNNKLKVFDNVVFETIPTITILNLSYNCIETLKSTISKTVQNLIDLDLSHNNILSINNTFFKPFLHLENLDLSFNKITFISENAFLQLSFLKTLIINNNFLKTVKFNELPTNLTKLYIGYNKIMKFPAELSQIRVLSIEHNNIYKLETDLTLLDSLEYLNISGNALSNFPEVRLQKIKILDISNNNYSSIPKSLSSDNFPLLNTLIISGNPIKNVKFNSKLKLQSFIANYMTHMQNIDKNAFINLEAPTYDCINLTISNNKKLIFIDEMALNHVNACFVDLSNNKISYISPKLLLSNGTLKMHNGVDLQENPFACNCSLQWMLNNLIPQLYTINPSTLNNLRCATPQSLLNKRMVHWYKWQKQVFCEDISELSDFSEKFIVHVEGVLDKKTIMFESSPGLLAVLGTAIVLLTLLIVTGIVLTQKLEKKRSRKNRRF